MVTWSVFAGATITVGVGMALLAVAIWRADDGPGVTALVAVVIGIALFSLAYGANLLTFDPTLSKLLEIPFWLAGELVIVAYFFFALAFTGRGQYLTRRNVVLVSLVPTITVFVAVTNSLGLHQWFWSDYHVVETLGAAVRVFDPGPWLYAKSTYTTILVGVAYLMFIEDIFIEQTLYRAQSIALVLGSVVPLTGFTTWLLKLGPYPQVDSSGLLFSSTIIFFGYAVFVADLFETAPAVRRLGRQNTIENLTEAVVIVTDGGVVTDFNEAATALLARRRPEVLGESLDALLEGDTLDFDRSTQVVSLQTTSGTRTFRVTVTPTTDDRGQQIGQTLLFYDITQERRREQRLAVLNRILRHNLRNDLNTVIGFSRQIADRTDDPQVVEYTERITGQATELAALGEKAWTFEQAIDGDLRRGSVAVGPIVEEVVGEYRSDYPQATIEVDVSPDAVVDADPRLLRLIVSNLVENGIEHHDGESPTVRIHQQAGAGDDTVGLAIRDDGPGIPEVELATLREGTEEQLQHSQGIGLWVVTWCVRTLGGTMEFDTGPAGTTVTVELEAAAPHQQAE